MSTDQALLAALAGLVLVVLVLLSYLLGSRQRAKSAPAPIALPPGMEALAPAFTELRQSLDAVRETVRGQVESVEKQLGDVRENLQRASTVTDVRAKQEDEAWQRIDRVEKSLATLQQVPESTQALQRELAHALQALADLKTLQTEARARWGTEDGAYTSLQRLSAVLLGSATAGASGERIVEEMLSTLPPQWVATNHKVGNKPVEFAIHLPDGLVLPIDSKFVAQAQLGALDQIDDAARRGDLEKDIRGKVLIKAKEVRQYVDARTPGFALLAVSDAAYRVCAPILPQAYQEHHALIVPYSLLAPFVLMVYEQHRRSAVDLESARMAELLANAADHVAGALGVVHGHMGRGLTQMQNAYAEVGALLGQAARELAQVRGENANVDTVVRPGVAAEVHNDSL